MNVVKIPLKDIDLSFVALKQTDDVIHISAIVNYFDAVIIVC